MGGLEKTYICMSSLELEIGQWTIIYEMSFNSSVSQPAESKENQNY